MTSGEGKAKRWLSEADGGGCGDDPCSPPGGLLSEDLLDPACSNAFLLAAALAYPDLNKTTFWELLGTAIGSWHTAYCRVVLK